jgi:hypothetical protein
MDANSHTRRDHRIGIARPLHHCSHRCIRTALIATVNQLLSHVWLAIESEARSTGELRDPDTTLIPLRTHFGATRSKAEKSNRLIYAAIASPCKPLQRVRMPCHPLGPTTHPRAAACRQLSQGTPILFFGPILEGVPPYLRVLPAQPLDVRAVTYLIEPREHPRPILAHSLAHLL